MKAARLLILGLLVVAVASASSSSTSSAEAPEKSVVLVHGLYGNPWAFALMQWDLEAKGYRVYALELPRSGAFPGDTAKNARFVQSFIERRGLTDVILGGHSLGGTLVEYYVRVLNKGEVTGRFTLDSNIESSGDTGLICLFVPDQCRNSRVRRAIFSADPRDDIPFLNVSSDTDTLPQVDCDITLPGAEHIFFPSLPKVRAAVVEFVDGRNPCDR